MEIFSEDLEIKEITIADIIKSNDKAIVITDQTGKNRGENKDNLVKEITAIDALELGPTAAAKINGVDVSSATVYSQGENIEDDETRARVLKHKYNIADTATTKLMETLGLFDPNGIEKQTDIVKAAASLAAIVEKVSSKDKNAGNEIHLHLYAPKQKKIESYNVIDV